MKITVTHKLGVKVSRAKSWPGVKLDDSQREHGVERVDVCDLEIHTDHTGLVLKEKALKKHHSFYGCTARENAYKYIELMDSGASRNGPECVADGAKFTAVSTYQEVPPLP